MSWRPCETGKPPHPGERKEASYDCFISWDNTSVGVTLGLCGAGRFGLCRVIDTVEDYISGNITVDQALGKLRYTSPNNQICILSQSLLDKYLRFVDRERLNDIREGRPV